MKWFPLNVLLARRIVPVLMRIGVSANPVTTRSLVAGLWEVRGRWRS